MFVPEAYLEEDFGKTIQYNQVENVENRLWIEQINVYVCFDGFILMFRRLSINHIDKMNLK